MMSSVFRLIVCCLVLVGCNSQSPVESIAYAIKGEAQGTTYSIKYFANEELVSKKSIDSILNVLDKSMSTWVDSSDISQFNASDSGAFVDQLFIDNLKLSYQVWKATDGCFNPLIKPLVNYWGFGEYSQKLENVDSNFISKLVDLTDLEDLIIKVDERAYSLKDIGLSSTIPKRYFLSKMSNKVMLDFNAIAQGYSVDLLGQFLKKNGVQSFLIELGGEMLVFGRKPNDTMWKVGVDKPIEGMERSLAAKVSVEDVGIATSGNYRKFYNLNGLKVHHTLNPITGYPAYHELLSATVIAENCALADALATSFMVMGLEKTVDFLENSELSKGVEVFLIFSSEEGEYKTYMTQGAKKMIETEL